MPAKAPAASLPKTDSSAFFPLNIFYKSKSRNVELKKDIFRIKTFYEIVRG